MEKKPDVAQSFPYVMEIKPGTYYWCQCGKSKSQPFCDSSHKGSGFAPRAVTITETKQVAFCGCKQTATPPFCDGSHSQLPK
jgi:CDGSH-type Zn-finger protein